MSEPVQVYTACQFVRLEVENKNVVITHFCIEFVEENDII